MSTKSRVILILILATIVAGLFIAASSLNSIVKKGVETVGPQIAKVPVNLESVNIVLLTGSAKVKGLVVGNPEGYKAPQAISIGLAEVGVNPFSIMSDKIVVRTIHVIDPELTFEGGLSGNNLSKIMENLNANAKTGGKPATNSATPAASQSGKKFQVDDFLVTGAKVHVHLTDLGKEMTLTLPDVRLADLGKGTDGLTPTDLSRAMLKAVSAATIKAISANVSDLGKPVDVDKIKKGIGGLLGK